MIQLKGAKWFFYIALIFTISAFRHTPKWYHILLWLPIFFFVDALAQVKAWEELKVRVEGYEPVLTKRGKKR
jgi:uncharacterized protein (DUF983 family)